MGLPGLRGWGEMTIRQLDDNNRTAKPTRLRAFGSALAASSMLTVVGVDATTAMCNSEFPCRCEGVEGQKQQQNRRQSGHRHQSRVMRTCQTREAWQRELRGNRWATGNGNNMRERK